MVAPGAAYQHFMSNYEYYILQKSLKDPTHFYVHHFERNSDASDDYYGSPKGLDDDTKPPIDAQSIEIQDYQEKARQYVVDYRESLQHD